MYLYIVHPNLTMEDYDEAERFYEILRKELEQHVPVIQLQSVSLLKSSSPKNEDAVVIFNGIEANSDENLINFLTDAKDAKSDIINIALQENMRKPYDVIATYQGFDVHDYLENRGLSRDFLEIAAIGLARKIISRLQPTLSKDTFNFFLSYRRIDGETISREFHQQLQQRFEHGFRDIVNIRIGEEAQQVIEENLNSSDAVIFLDTPRAGESPWIAREISIALALNIPIIWIKINDDAERVALPIKPADKPHFFIGEQDKSPDFIDKVIRKTFDICREHAYSVFDHLRRIKSLRDNHVTLIEHDKKHMVYEIKIPRASFRYPQKPMSHLIQFYGRRPQATDCDSLLNHANSFGFQTDHYDATILLGVTPSVAPECREKFFIDSAREYVASLENYFNSNKGGKPKGLIISGAFPDCEPEYQQYITNAVHAFAQATFDTGNIVIFGGHPTFQHLILDMAQIRRPNDFIEATHLYLSKYFIGMGAIDDFRKKSTLVMTDVVDDDRAASLTLMRKTMISNKFTSGMIVIGGKTDANGHSPGVDEEIELAKQSGIPIFLLGSVGGRSSHLAMKMDKEQWKQSLNQLSVEQNKQLLFSTDYMNLASMVLKSI